jgi:3-hydroxybutyryl-CoA dehydrogenase
MQTKKIGVIGAGEMGSGIAQVAAEQGLDVALLDIDLERAEAGVAAIERRLNRQAQRRRITGRDADACLARISPQADWESLDSLRDADAVIEAVVENLEVKKEVFRRLGEVCKPDALLSSNTSSLPLSQLAGMSGRPERVIGLHFFNPPWALKLVEVVPTASTSEETLEEGLALCKQLGRVTVRVEDTPGFIANRLLVPFIFDAIHLLDAGIATAEDIDLACQVGLNHRMGPVATADLIGLDTLEIIAESMFQEYGEPRFKAPTMLKRLVALGHLGRKTGHGFYVYD